MMDRRGPNCVLSYEAVAVLRARGFKVCRLEDGLPEWRAEAHPLGPVESERQSMEIRLPLPAFLRRVRRPGREAAVATRTWTVCFAAQ